ncbi:MAG: SRPBCC domain-containing protein [Actinobacteria bacterium]|nr:SRPBCC domain-containing protein [Actinomycetota bacterium]
MSEPAAGTTLVMSRVFAAPRPLVFRAFTDPDQLAAWFGPVGWSVPCDTVAIEPRIGGRWDLTMVNDDDPSMTSPVAARFSDFIENELIVGEQDAEGVDGFEGNVRLTLRLEFHDEGDGSTRLELRQGPYVPSIMSGAQQGWGSSFDKLDALLAAA